MRKSFLITLLMIGVLGLLAACDSLLLYESDQEAFDSLVDAGSDLTEVHPFDFYIYHENKAGAQHICGQLNQRGFETNVQDSVIEGEFLCLARYSFIPSIEKLTEFGDLFDELIDIHGGEYDGWETIVIQ